MKTGKCNQKEFGGKEKNILLFAVLLALFVVGTIYWQKEQNHISRVFCMGDSITYGTGVMENRDTESYPAQLQQLLGDRYEVYNYGASGRTLLNDTNKPYLDTGYIDAVKVQSPDIIVIMLGSNDSKAQNWQEEDYKKQYIQLIKEFKNLSEQPDIYIAVPPEAFARGSGKVAYGINNTVIRNEIRKCIYEVAKETEVNVIDMYSVTEDHPEYFRDGVHPNKEGNALLAQAVYENIQ